jgi:hypothetical protein
MSDNLGEDLGGIDDLDLEREISGMRLLAEDIACRLACPAGGLLDDSSYGIDLPGYLNETATPRALLELQGLIAGQVLADERVDRATSVQVTTTGHWPVVGLNVSVAGRCASGPFRLTLAVDQVSVKVLEAR